MRRLHLTAAEVQRYRSDLSADGAAFRAELAEVLQALADGAGEPAAAVGAGIVVLLALPKVLEQDARDLDPERDAGGPPTRRGH